MYDRSFLGTTVVDPLNVYTGPMPLIDRSGAPLPQLVGFFTNHVICTDWPSVTRDAERERLACVMSITQFVPGGGSPSPGGASSMAKAGKATSAQPKTATSNAANVRSWHGLCDRAA